MWVLLKDKGFKTNHTTLLFYVVFLILFSSNIKIICSEHMRRFCKGCGDWSEIFTHFGKDLKAGKHLTAEQCQKWSVIGKHPYEHGFWVYCSFQISHFHHKHSGLLLLSSVPFTPLKSVTGACAHICTNK